MQKLIRLSQRTPPPPLPSQSQRVKVHLQTPRATVVAQKSLVRKEVKGGLGVCPLGTAAVGTQTQILGLGVACALLMQELNS